ncbi:MAG: V-type ATP synthase subunit C [Candidatus Micrarchaeota archaeon]|nr:MAG: V-type ATP synthase subunit C [Candidatus Micrarchaeota archaeon]
MSKVRRYSYSNARAKRLYAELLKPSQLEEIMHLKDVSSILNYIYKTSYSKYIDAAASRVNQDDKLALIDYAVSLSISDAYRKLRAALPIDILDQYYIIFDKPDIDNISLMISSKLYGIDSSIVLRRIIETRNIKMELVRQIINESNVSSLIRRLKESINDRFVLRILDSISNKQDVLIADQLDSYYYKELSKLIVRAKSEDLDTAKLIKYMLEAYNIRILIRSKLYHISQELISSLLIQNAITKGDSLNRLIAADSIKQLVSNIRSIDLTKALESYEKENKLYPFEVGIDRYIFDKIDKILRVKVFSLSTIVGYLTLKEYETALLRYAIGSKIYNIAEQI